MSNAPIGYYCWAGPGTIRMIKLKYFDPEIDTSSLMSSYDYEYLAELQQKFGVTDFWATYSWGFSPEVEAEDYQFFKSKLENFHRLGINVHAYIQGTNLVYADYPDVDWWCLDPQGRTITYYRGRKVVCVNNPGFREYILQKLTSVCQQDIAGVFMDNVQMGQLGVPVFEDETPFVFAGCACKYCQARFREVNGADIPSDFDRDIKLTREYLKFRTDSLHDFLAESAKIVHQSGKKFGTNSYDPKYVTTDFFGFDLKRLAEIQDYYLFENHSLPNAKQNKSNFYIHRLAKQLSKPVFLVSYKQGIGMESAFTQEDFDLVYSEYEDMAFNICIKGSEYTTNGIWHNLRVGEYNAPNRSLKGYPVFIEGSGANFVNRLIGYFVIRSITKRVYNPLFTLVMENRYFRILLELAYRLSLRA